VFDTADRVGYSRRTGRPEMTEVEVKLAVGPAGSELQRLRALGLELEHPRAFEDNVLLDMGGGKLGERGAMLRVRRYGAAATLTYKEPMSGPGGYKIRSEVETSVGDPDALVAALRGAGFEPIWRYQKYRTILRADRLKVLLDETPIGNYLELEGPPAAIDALAARLGRTPADYITASYRELMSRWCEGRGEPLADMLLTREGAP